MNCLSTSLLIFAGLVCGEDQVLAGGFGLPSIDLKGAAKALVAPKPDDDEATKTNPNSLPTAVSKDTKAPASLPSVAATSANPQPAGNVKLGGKWAPGAPKGWVIPSEFVAYNGRLYFTGWAADVKPDTEVSFHLRGADPEQVVTQRVKAYSTSSPFDTSGEVICQGVSPGSRELPEDACSFDMKDLKAGGTYSIAVFAGDKELASTPFNIIAEPGVGGTKILDVDPVSRAGKAYYHPRGLVYWYLVDARLGSDVLTVSWIKNGVVKETTISDIRGPDFVDEELIRSAAPIIFNNPAIGRFSGRDEVPGDWTAIILLNGETPLTSIAATYQQLYENDQYGYTNVDIIRSRGGYGPIKTTAVDPKLLDAARKSARDAMLKSNRTGTFAMRPEPTVCAVALEKRASEIVKSLADLHLTDIGFADRNQKAEAVLANRNSTSAERAAARKEVAAMQGGVLQTNNIGDKWITELQALSKKYKSGCMEPLFASKGRSISTL